MLKIYDCISNAHDLRLVVLAAFICLLASFAAISLLHHVRRSTGRAYYLWLSVAAISTGFGIWATHFIAMLAFTPGVPSSYNVALTFLSLVAAILLTGAGLAAAVISNKSAGMWLGGAMVGGGIAAMHYIGMAAFEIPGRILWDPVLVAVSIALGAALGSLSTRVGLADDSIKWRICGALLLTAAICSHHFTAMGAISIVPDPTIGVSIWSVPTNWLATATALASVIILGSALAGLTLDVRQQRSKLLETERMRGLANAALEGLIFCHEDTIVTVNKTFTNLVGDEEAVGAKIEKYFADETSRIALSDHVGQPIETLLLHSGGSTIPVEAVLRLVDFGDTPHRAIAIRDLRARKEAERRAEEAERMVATVLDNAPLPIVVRDPGNDKIVLLNRAYAQFLGQPREALIGKTPFDIFPTAQANKVVEFDKDTVAAGGREIKSELVLQTTWGGDRDVFRTATVVKDNEDKPQYIIVSFDDVTETNLAKKELLTQKILTDTAINNMSQGLVMFDENRRIVLCNERYIRMYGLSRDIVRAGCTLAELEQHCANIGSAFADPIKVLKLRTEVITLENGAVIKRITRRLPTGGWVVTHEDLTALKLADERIKHMAHHDALTGLPNRALLHEQLERQLSSVKRGSSLAVLCLDLDHFKQVNDTLGHPIGDGLLRAVGERLRDNVRDTDMVARLGGDEFAIIQTELEQPSSAGLLAQRIVDKLTKPFAVNDHEIVVGTSIGIAIAPTDGIEADILMKCADMALYRVKESGRNGFSFFEAGMDKKLRERRHLEIDLRKAIACGELELFYQPIVEIKPERICGFEALLRWNHPERGMVAPDAFIPLAEETALIVPIGEWVLREACAEASKWPEHIRVAVNLSAVQFRDKSLVSIVTSAIVTAGINACRLELEITETTLLQNIDETRDVLYALKNLGVRISMDDFGTGYSSLSYLQSFPFDKIKIDRSFVSQIAKSEQSTAIVHAVSVLGMRFGMVTTAEGIETIEQLEIIKAEGCREVQGYLFGKPQPASEVQKLLTQDKDQVAA